MMRNLNRVALVTGSSRGIGRAIAIELASNGIDIVVNSSKSPEKGLGVVYQIKKIGGNAIYVQADVSDPDQVKKMIERILKEFGTIHILINNAGIVMDRKLENMSIDEWNKVMSVNLTGAFNCTKAVIQHMKKRGGGKIINIASVVGEMGNFGQSNYAASKGGLIAFTKTVAKEYARDGITVNAVAPGFIQTGMVKGIPQKVLEKILQQIPIGRLGEPEEVAKLVCFLASDDADYITGQVINVNGGIYT